MKLDGEAIYQWPEAVVRGPISDSDHGLGKMPERLRGAVIWGFSTKAVDGTERFTDPDIVRRTLILNDGS